MDKDLARFYASIIDFSIDDACWEWGAAQFNGYGRFNYKRKAYQAHRWIYEHYIGIIPPGYEIDHKCRNRSCVNLRHLEVVTKAENIRRAFAARPTSIFCKNGHIRTEENTKIERNGRRRCIICRRIAAGVPIVTYQRRTHCFRGHEFNEENTYVRPDGSGYRTCRICMAVGQRERRAARNL